MKNVILLISTVIIFVFTLNSVQAQPDNTPKLLTIAAEAVIVEEPTPHIELRWEKHPYIFQYEIRKKLITDAIFPGGAMAQLDSSHTSFVDDNITLGSEYEYEVRGYYRAKQQIFEQTAEEYLFAATAYLYTGIEIDVQHHIGKCILVIDENISESLPGEITRLEEDLIREGWYVVRKYVERTEEFDGAKVKLVKNKIKEEFDKHPNMETYVFLLGRVAVPYSGNIVPDGHSNNHYGAWPADGYYGSLNESRWTDSYTNSTATNRTNNENAPGDGKFDQSKFENAPVSLPVGRVDLYNMPTFELSEVELLKNYLDRNHAYRTGEMEYVNRGLIDDNFGIYGMNGFSSSAWRSFPIFVGTDSIHDKTAGYDWFTTLSTDSYLWAYGCGGGSYKSCGGIGVTEQFDTIPVNAVFTMLFGSYFGDWDVENSFLRAPLASQPQALTCCWAGRPHWFMHHMDNGIPIGYSTRLSQNNVNQYLGLLVTPNEQNYYFINQSAQEIHIALMGDPTLKMYMGKVAEPTNISVAQLLGRKVQIDWNAPEIEGEYKYNVYRAETYNGPYEKLNDAALSELTFLDSNIIYGPVHYMVRAEQLETTRSGSFLNLSRGIMQNANISDVDDSNGLITSVSCYPNPASKQLNITLELEDVSNTNIQIFDSRGNLIKTFKYDRLHFGTHSLSWNLITDSGHDAAAGAYYIRVSANDKVKVSTFTVVR